MIKFTPLFSGSKGNSYLIQSAQCNILLDAGYGYRALVARLGEANIAPQDISAIVISHEHSDHIGALRYWTKSYRTPIFVPKNCGAYILQSCCCANITEISAPFVLGDISVDVFPCSHDARGCFGYKFSDGKTSVATVTDLGVAPDNLADFLADCQTVALESNHDADMLWNGPYPYVLKRRIASELGHLSNAQCAEVLDKLLGGNVKNIVLAHLSEQNNTKQLALQSAMSVVQKHNLTGSVNVYVADQYKNGITL